VAGTTVGAGILALPAVTRDAGYWPSSAVICGCWLYACVTGLLVAETNIRLMCELGRGGVSLLSMAKSTYDRPGEILAGGSYIFLHYALLVAYISRGGELVSTFVDISPAFASMAFTVLVGGTVYASDESILDNINTGLVMGVVVSFLAILSVALASFDLAALSESSDAGRALSCIPVVALAFVYHNIIPVISSSLEGDRKKITTAIVVGTGIPLAMFLLWNGAILGYSVPDVAADPVLEAGAAAEQVAEQIVDPLKLLQEDATVGTYISAFSLLAVATSFIGFVLGLVDFIGDGMKMPTNTRNALPFIVTLFPPAVFALGYPDIFLQALEYAGTYGVLGLFGILPAAMAWKARERDDLSHLPTMVPGGKPVLALVGGSALVVMVQQTALYIQR